MLVLGIESTCDETACAIVCNGHEILSNIVTSQIDLHNEFGGVVPELACRRHVDVIILVIDEALKRANVNLCDIDLIAAARGPGLIGAVLLGLNAAKTLSLILDKPFVGVNHVEAHLYGAWMSSQKEISLPCIGVILSGGHTALVLIEKIGSYQLISQTVDDAIGEAFDKVAQILGLPYPGGPEIEKIALQGNHLRFAFKSGTVKSNPLAFSFSGLKTAVLYQVKGQSPGKSIPSLLESDKSDIAASFQHAAFQDILLKTKLASEKYGCRTILFGGGVTNNQTLRTLFAQALPDYHLFWPSKGLSLDNAAMIAGLGYHQYLLKGQGDSLDLEAMPNLNF